MVLSPGKSHEQNSGKSQTPLDSLDYISETPGILIINDEPVPPDGPSNNDKGPMLGKVGDSVSPLNFKGLESPNSIAPSWQENRLGPIGRKGGGKDGKKGGRGSSSLVK